MLYGKFKATIFQLPKTTNPTKWKIKSGGHWMTRVVYLSSSNSSSYFEFAFKNCQFNSSSASEQVRERVLLKLIKMMRKLSEWVTVQVLRLFHLFCSLMSLQHCAATTEQQCYFYLPTRSRRRKSCTCPYCTLTSFAKHFTSQLSNSEKLNQNS